MKALIKQPAGIGDIFFCQKIANKLRELSYEVVWPVIPEFLWIKDYIEGIDFCLVDTVDESEFDTILPLHQADQRYRNMSVMEAKYALVNLRWDNWSDHFNFKRNKNKEDKLFYDVLKLQDNSEYAFKNFYFASPPHTQICEAAKRASVGDLQEICMSNMPEFTLIDWCKVIQNAKEIHTVETSLNYIIEKIKTTDKLHMYSKWNPPSYYHVKKLFKKPWTYHE